MKQNTYRRSRQKILSQMAQVFGERIRFLSLERQEILLDDMVTAFENRLTMLSRAELHIKPCIDVAKVVELEA